MISLILGIFLIRNFECGKIMKLFFFGKELWSSFTLVLMGSKSGNNWEKENKNEKKGIFKYI